jgi:dienelactone hydrolase
MATTQRRAFRAPVILMSALMSALVCAATACSPVIPIDSRPVYRRRPRFAVGVRTETFVDSTRPTPPNGPFPGSPNRALETVIMYPARGTPDPLVELPNAPPLRHRFPLIVYAHGLSGGFVSSFLHEWASAGFVVAAPSFPLTRHDAPGGPNAADYVNEPGDVSFVISQMLDLPTELSDLQPVIRRHAVGVVGASLGAGVALGVAYNSCCHDQRVKATIAISGGCEVCPRGGLLPYGSGEYFTGKSPVPLMLVHGTADPFAPYRQSLELFADAPTRTFLVSLLGAPHIAFPEPWFSIAVASTIDFFDRYLKHHRAALRRLTFDANVRGVANLAQK